jgi:TonB family protein
VKFCVSTAGAVKNVQIVKSSGYPELDQAIKSAVNSWRFRPYSVNGKAVEACTAKIFQFLLTD